MSAASARTSSYRADAIGSTIRFEITIENEEWHQQNADILVFHQWFPRQRTEFDSIHKAPCPIRCDNLPDRPLPEYRVEVVRCRTEAGDDLIIAAHDRAEDGTHLSFRLELWFDTAQTDGSHLLAG